MRKAALFNLAITAFAFSLGAYLFHRLPRTMATHWGIDSQVNGYSPRTIGVFALPAIMLILWVIFQVAPMIDPKRKNIEQFRQALDRFTILMFMFLEYLYLVTLAWNLGYRFDFDRFVLPTLAILYLGIGDLLAVAEPNWTIGIRSPWTLSSGTVWRRTNRVAGTLFKYSAAVAALTLFFPAYGLYLVVAPAIATALIALIYSYMLFRREESRKN